MPKDSEDGNKKLEQYRNESYLETALRDKNLRSVYNFILTGILCIVIQNAINDYYFDGGSQYGFKRFLELTSSFPTLAIWMPAMLTFHFVIFLYWKLRIKLKGVKVFLNLGWKQFFPICVCFHIFGVFNLIGYLCTLYKVSLICRALIIFIYLALCLKQYSFLRTNMKNLYEKGEKYKPPTFTHYFYFSCAPVLLYKDEYLRSTKGRSWWKVFYYFFEFVASIYTLLLIDGMYISKHLQNFGKQPFGVLDVVYNIYSLTLPGFMMCLIGHNLLINVANCFLAELICFGERKFCTDWWTSTNLSSYYMKSNKYVQDFIYVHIYKEFYDYMVPGNKTIAIISVFAISSVMHDLVIFYCCKLVLPPFIITMLYSITQSFYPKTGHVFNFLTLFHIYMGMSTVYNSLAMEYFAKVNCANRPESLLYFPRLLSCDINK